MFSVLTRGLVSPDRCLGLESVFGMLTCCVHELKLTTHTLYLRAGRGSFLFLKYSYLENVKKA
jgi:hypothetical protein